MPTLIIVQVGLGRAVHDLETNNNASRNIHTETDELQSHHRSKDFHYSSNDTFVYHPDLEK